MTQVRITGATRWEQLEAWDAFCATNARTLHRSVNTVAREDRARIEESRAIARKAVVHWTRNREEWAEREKRHKTPDAKIGRDLMANKLDRISNKWGVKGVWRYVCEIQRDGWHEIPLGGVIAGAQALAAEVYDILSDLEIPQ
jgi:hypothetical protein